MTYPSYPPASLGLSPLSACRPHLATPLPGPTPHLLSLSLPNPSTNLARASPLLFSPLSLPCMPHAEPPEPGLPYPTWKPLPVPALASQLEHVKEGEKGGRATFNLPTPPRHPLSSPVPIYSLSALLWPLQIWPRRPGLPPSLSTDPSFLSPATVCSTGAASTQTTSATWR